MMADLKLESDEKLDVKLDEKLDEKLDIDNNQIQMNERMKKEIEDEVKKLPLVGDPEDFGVLLQEYKENEKFIPKIEELSKIFNSFTRIRGDGNCFYRAFLVGLLTLFADGRNSVVLKDLKTRIADTCKRLVKLGYPDFTTEDFFDNFDEVLTWVLNKERSEKEIIAHMRDEGLSNYLVVYAKLLVSLQLKENPQSYQAFLNTDIYTYCSKSVEPSFAEADDICITALMNELGCGIGSNIGYLDQSDKLVFHKIPDASLTTVNLLYRPGHYDLLK